MTRGINRLKETTVRAAKKRGYYADGGNLYLQVSEWRAKDGTVAQSKSWIFRYLRKGKLADLGLGPLHTVKLAQARLKATAFRQLLLDGKDPKDTRDEQRRQHQLDAAKAVTFQQCAENYIKAHEAEWKNPKHGPQWHSTLATYAYPVFGPRPVCDIDTELVLAVLKPIWETKHETASRIRQRIKKVLDSATSLKQRTGENPARWEGHLEHHLATLSKEDLVEHQPALPYSDMPSFMPELRAHRGVGARALEFAILTAMRTEAVLGAKPAEFDLDEAVWTVPAARMKGKGRKDHKVPLSPRAVAIAREQIAIGFDHVFAVKPHSPLSTATMLAVLKRLHAVAIEQGKPGWCDSEGRRIVPHGFRSTFKDWAADRTHFPNIVSEMALAHKVPDKVEAAYRRGELLQKRRQLMDAWAAYCVAPRLAKVVSIAA